MVDSFFSRQSIQRTEEHVKGSVDRICDHVEAARTESRPIDMSMLYRYLTVDVISFVTFGESYDFLNRPLNEGRPFLAGHRDLMQTFPVIKEIPGVLWLLEKASSNLPMWVFSGDEGTTAVLKWMQVRLCMHFLSSLGLLVAFLPLLKILTQHVSTRWSQNRPKMS